MDPQLLEWTSLLLRWLHVTAAIAWIGASFYFIWLDLALEPVGAAKAERGLAGELWAIHGGGIYEIGKYRLAPPRMPARLHWFKWEAYGTWLSGTALLVVIYYLRPDAYLIGPESWLQSAPAAIAASVAYLGLGLGAYEAAMRLPAAARALPCAALLAALTLAASAIAFALFAPRAATLHVGALLATWMAANVFVHIIPGQRALVAAIERGTAPDPSPAITAKRRSTHNNYLTLPVVFCMISNHYPFVYGHPLAWLVVPAFAAVAALARHYFNERHRGRERPALLGGAALAFVAVATATVATAGGLGRTSAGAAPPPQASEVRSIVTARCAGCHAAEPSFPGYQAPPAGLVLVEPADLETYAGKVAPALRSAYMPLGNLTAMTDAERSTLLAWLER